MRQAVSTESAPSAIGPYSQAIRAGSLLIVSGQVPIDPATGAIVFTSPAPARATVQVSRLPKDARVEIDVIASV